MEQEVIIIDDVTITVYPVGMYDDTDEVYDDYDVRKKGKNVRG